MKKILFLFVAIQLLLSGTAFGQAKTYFHDRIDTTIFAVADTVGHGSNNYYATNTSPDFNVNHYENGLNVILFIKPGNSGPATLTLVTRTGTLSTRSIRKSPGAVLASGDIKDSCTMLFTYYNGHWRLGDMIPASSSSWMLTGNAGTVAANNFLGTTDAVDLVLRTNNTEKARISSAGVLSLGLASTNNGSLLFRNSTNANTLTINSGVTSASYALTLPTAQGAANTLLLNDGAGTLSWNTGAGLFWGLTGNAGTVAGVNFVGTTDAVDFVTKTNGVERMRVASGGTVTIGSGSPSFGRFSVIGTQNAITNYDITLAKSGASAPSVYLAYNNDESGAIALENAAHNANVFSVNNLITDSHDYINTGSARNTGIGTSSPPVKLSVNATSATGFIGIYNTTVGQGFLGYRSQGGTLELNNAAGNAVLIKLNNPGVDSYFNDGNQYCIGTTDGPFKLNVNSSSATDGVYALKNDVGQSFLGYNADGGYLALNNSAGNTEMVKFVNGGDNWINTTQNLGIGLASSISAKVHIKGTGSTSVTVTCLLENSSGTDGFIVLDDSRIITPGIHNNSNGSTGDAYLASGTYTFVATDSANTSANTTYEAQWMRVGNVVTVSGVIDVDPTSTTTITILKFLPPIVSNFTATSDCRGTANAEAISGQSAAILCTSAYGVSDYVLMKWNAVDVTNQPMSYTYTYEVK